MNYILFDGAHRDSLLPFTYTRPVAEIRIGILTIREKWEQYLGITTTTVTEDYLSKKWPMVEMEHNIMISASYLPNPNLVEQIKNLKVGQALVHDTEIVAFYTLEDEEKDLEDYQTIEIDSAPITVKHTWDIFSKNGDAIKEDYNLITEDRSSQPLSSSVFAVNPNNIFIEEGAKVFNVSLNAENGPIYIGKDAEVMEGSIIRGPFALCEHASTKLGTKIYGPTTVGPHSKVGGEVNNSVIFGYSNKGHDGFLGNSVLGEWCNIGADSNNSNLKNNYAEVRLWSYETEGFAKTGLQFCGLMMGDHSKCGINTMFNTGTVVGVSSNIFGAGFPRNFVPSFSWGGSAGTQTYLTKKAFEVAEIVMKRREIEFSDDDKAILEHVFEETAKFRRS
ncbi:GlmU family protein [Croceibacter atlanticus]|jgi:UDP-N-acetylglucosamine diphosphorylase/glucosamine-1-phosphate N-acetyltransferase|uniref:GlmU family protein n=1 Tax=Croceibacter atlanticus TaxID=313588 RepID=UPI002E15B63E|nr:GlmU family protein [Croceibacter atlanticus]